MSDRPRILIVEDEAIVARDVESMLRDLGYQVVGIAATGEAAIAKAKETCPDLVLMDIKLRGDIDGVKAAEEIAASVEVPVIFVTANSDDLTLQRAKVTTPFGYVLKPFEPRELHIAVEIALYRHVAERELVRVHKQNEELLAAVPSVLIGVDAEGKVVHWNGQAEAVFAIAAEQAVGQRFRDCPVRWSWTAIEEKIALCLERRAAISLKEFRYQRPDEREGFLNVTISPYHTRGGPAGFLMAAEEVTEYKILQQQFLQAQKLESIGQLAAGIAHEINTPTQFIGDNTRFLRDSFAGLFGLVNKYRELKEAARQDDAWPELVASIDALEQEVDLDYLAGEIPLAIDQTLEGVDRVAHIVQAMRAFSHPGGQGKTAVDFNKAIETTVTVARNEWKYVADVEMALDNSLPQIQGLPNEINQVILNILLNATHAIKDVVGARPERKGKITISTHRTDGWVEMRISDTGPGIPAAIRHRIFDPFFTTKPVGTGTGQGLAIAHCVVVEKHKGSITFETAEGKGTTFIVRLPINGA
ncbi:MAG: response regulator [candidate division KSB1 bacterium]|jgi:PAS domain S-box-containing protein|nr:response regulator [candidate division KSB1 bacterium]